MDELREKAQAIMSKNPLVEIVFKGFVPNKEVELYYASNPVDIFINLSTIEGLPISIMEAISYGIPIIATDVGGTKEIVCKDVGMLLPQNITTQLVLKSIEDFYLRPQNEQQKMRSSAYNYWKFNFDATHNIKKLFSLINNL
jgi:glycosyltransferase involved in cell wall biosynthesis